MKIWSIPLINIGKPRVQKIDVDYSGNDRDRVKQFLLKDRMGIPSIKSAEIITFNTIAVKGAVRDVCRALYKESEKINYLELSDRISKLVDSDEDEARRKYPEVFKYVDIVNGTIVSIGTHPSGVLISDLPIENLVGLCSTGTSPYPVSMLNMKELDALFYVKLDILGLDNIGIINKTCESLGIERLTPDNTDLNDMNVWRDIRDDTTLIFQWESNSAQQYIKKFMSDATIEAAKSRSKDFSMIKWLSFGNGLIRPACASFRDSVANGEFYDNGFKELNDFLAPEAGRIAMQETIMRFLVKFCGYTDSESDNVRRAIAKKKGTETLLPEIERRFIEYAPKHYDISEEDSAKIIKPFIQIILDASAYSFSWNHSDAYSCIGYISGWLRYYYPLEFLTAALNIFSDDMEKVGAITKYASKRGIKVTSPKWGISRRDFFYDKNSNSIAKGLSSVKYIGDKAADELYELSQKREFDSFTDLLFNIFAETSVNTRQLDILIKIGFFDKFGNQRELIRITEIFNDTLKGGEAKKIEKSKVDGTPLGEVIARHSTGVTKAGEPSKFYTVTDMGAIMRDVEDLILSLGLTDLSDILKVRNFTDAMGYMGYISGNEQDRPKLYVKKMFPAKRKKDGKQFGWNIYTQSIGSGKEASFTVFNDLFDKDPIKEDDVILCASYSREGKYFTLKKYQHIY